MARRPVQFVHHTVEHVETPAGQYPGIEAKLTVGVHNYQGDFVNSHIAENEIVVNPELLVTFVTDLFGNEGIAEAKVVF